MNTLGNRFKRLCRDRRGASAVEFALVVPMLITMTCAVFQYGTLMFAYNGMMNAARDTTRQMSIGAETAATAPDKARADLPRWVAPSNWDIVAEDTAATNEVNTRITVNSTDVSLLRLVPMPATMSVDVVMQKEV